jgi:hypothetical protein
LSEASELVTAGRRRQGVVRHRMAFLERWRQHNAGKAGSLPRFLPVLYDQEGD